ncbi:hypothetical protein F4778DRAFT_801046 [Xylariomycetidae sp. FL2044]|nr:hypothetical protein F4778DRAFT_801046 [Xylariomycetidae sp. FL2044]
MSSSAVTVPKWVADLKSPPAPKPKNGSIPDPPGYPSQSGTVSKKQASKESKIQPRKQPTPEEMDTLKLKKAWEVALAPVKNLPMTAIMMYMSGNSLQIFSIMMVYMAFKNPFMGILSTNQAFERFESDTNKGKMVQVKLAYIAMQLLALAVGVWKVNAMGLLPTTRSDWLAWEPQREPLEYAVTALGMLRTFESTTRTQLLQLREPGVSKMMTRYCGRHNGSKIPRTGGFGYCGTGSSLPSSLSWEGNGASDSVLTTARVFDGVAMLAICCWELVAKSRTGMGILIPDEPTAHDVEHLLRTGYEQNPESTLQAVYALLKTSKLQAGGDADAASLGEVAADIGRIIEPRCPGATAQEDPTDYPYLARQGELGLQILDILTRTYDVPLQSPTLLHVTAYTQPLDPWTTPTSRALARSLLDSQLPTRDRRTKFITDKVLNGFLRGLFSRARPATVTASGRKAEFVEPSRYNGHADRELAEAKPWKYEMRYAVAVFEWAVEEADQPHLQTSWPLYTPVLLTLLDDPSTPLKLRALRALRLFWRRCPPGLMQNTGLAEVFEHAVFPAVLYLPSLTPVDESLEILGAAYPALFAMAGIVSQGEEGVVDDDGDGEEKRGGREKTTDREFTGAQRVLLDKIVREGLLVGYHHAKEHIRLVQLFCDKLRYVVDGMGILAVRHLKDIIAMLTEIITDPFGTQHPPTLLSATRLLQAVLRNCWPRIPHYGNEVIKMLMLCWLHICDEDRDGGSSVGDDGGGGSASDPEMLKTELVKTADMLAAIMKAANVNMSERVGVLVEKEPLLGGLFRDGDK